MSAKKVLTILALLLISLAMSTGCGIGGSENGGHGNGEENLAPIEAEEWPTPPPTPMPPTPTPFPKVTLAPTATPTAPPIVLATPEPLTTTVDLSADSDMNTLIEQVSAAGGGLEPVAAGLVIGEDVPLRSGPGAAYGTVSATERGDLLAIFGTDSAGAWLYVLTVSLERGWLPAEAARVTGSLAEAPVLPANPLGEQINAASPTSTAPATVGGSEPADAAGAATGLTPADLEPVATARVDNFALNMRQGPGAAYGQLGSLARDDEVGILAFNRTRDWVLVESAGGEYGWVSLPFLAVEDALEDVPTVLSPTPDTTIPAGQVAPIRPAGNIPVSGGPADGEQGRTLPNAAAPVPASFNSPSQNAPAVTNLAPVATALIGRREVDLQPGPGSEFAPFKTLTQDDEQIAILGVDDSGDWTLVNPEYSDIGWAALADLNLTGGSAGSAPTVYTGWVQSNGVEVRRGPGIYEDVTGSLAINTLVQVLGLDKNRSYALVKPFTGEGMGWTPVQFLTTSVPASMLPEAPDLPAPQPVAAGQPAAAPSLPAKPLNQTRLVFQTSSGGDIMVINGDGTGLRRLTSGIDPILSPDGQKVAFTRWEGETGTLWTIDLDGSNERPVLGFIKQAKGPSWSPDGSQIVLNYQHGGRVDPTTTCYDLADDPPRPPRNARNIRVGMDDSMEPRLCWDLPPDPYWGLRVITVADGSFEDVDGGTYAFRPTWDPTQAWRIVSDGGRGLVQVDVNQDSNRTITDKVHDGSPVFSPDGRYLALVSGQGGQAGLDIHRTNADGSGRVRLTKTPVWVTALPDNNQAWNNVAPAWSPDGSQIAFLTDREGRWEIWVMNVDGSNQRPLFSDEINDQLDIEYNFVDERVMSWG